MKDSPCATGEHKAHLSQHVNNKIKNVNLKNIINTSILTNVTSLT